MKVRTKFLMFTILITLFLGMFVYNESFAAVPDYGEPGSYNTAFSIDLVCESLENYEVDMSGDYGYETRVYSENILDEDFYVKIASLVDMGETIETSSFGVLNYVGTEEIVGRHCYIYTADITDKKIFDNKIIEDLRYPEYNFKFYYEISLKDIVYISDLNINVNTENKYYTGEELETPIVIKDGQYILKEGTDYTVFYNNNIFIGTATVTITGIGNYHGKIIKEFEIISKPLKDISELIINVNTNEHIYTGEPIEPSVEIIYNDSILKLQDDYVVNYKNNTNIGIATITITGKGNYTGTIEKTFNIVPSEEQVYECGYYEYRLLIDGTAEIVKYKGQEANVDIPNQLNDFVITSIGKSAFYNNQKIISIKMPSTINNIESEAFSNSFYLEKISLSNKIKNIGKYAFSGCTSLINIQLPGCLEVLDDGVFHGCDSLVTINLPNRLKTICAYSFKGCVSLNFIEIPNGINTIEQGAFADCVNLNNIIVPNSVNKITTTNLDTDIFENTNQNLTIYGQLDSYIQQYANLKQIEFKDINDFNIENIYEIYEVGKRRETSVTIQADTFSSTYWDAYWEIEDKNIAKIKNSKKSSLQVGINYRVITAAYIEGVSIGETYLTLRAKDGTIIRTFRVKVIMVNEDISDLNIGDISAQTYTGEEIKPNISIKSSDGRILGKDIDYTMSYSNNINKGTATVIIKGIDTYKGEIIKTFEINAKDIFTLENNISTTAQDYNGEELKSDIWFKHNDYNLVEGKDYTVSYSNNKYPGIATFTITGLGNYSGTTTKEFKINKGYIPIEYSYGQTFFWYDGKEHTGSINIKNPQNAIVKYMDSNGNYTLDTPPKYIEVGVYTIKHRIFVNDYYTDALGEQTITIEKSYLNNYSSDYEGIYDGKEHSINVNIDSKEYDIKYSVDNQNYDMNSLPMFINPGEYTVNYRVTNRNYNDLIGSNRVRIYGVKSFDSTMELRNNILVIKNYKNIFDEVCKRIKIYAPSWGYAYYDVTGNISYNAMQLVQTGGSIGIEINNRTEFKYNVAVLADVNGDGKISALDYVKIKNHIMKTNLINSDVYLTAADVNDDGKISALDYVRIKNYIMNGGV